MWNGDQFAHWGYPPNRGPADYTEDYWSIQQYPAPESVQEYWQQEGYVQDQESQSFGQLPGYYTEWSQQPENYNYYRSPHRYYDSQYNYGQTSSRGRPQRGRSKGTHHLWNSREREKRPLLPTPVLESSTKEDPKPESSEGKSEESEVSGSSGKVSEKDLGPSSSSPKEELKKSGDSSKELPVETPTLRDQSDLFSKENPEKTPTLREPSDVSMEKPEKIRTSREHKDVSSKENSEKSRNSREQSDVSSKEKSKKSRTSREPSDVSSKEKPEKTRTSKQQKDVSSKEKSEKSRTSREQTDVSSKEKSQELKDSGDLEVVKRAEKIPSCENPKTKAASNQDARRNKNELSGIRSPKSGSLKHFKIPTLPGRKGEKSPLQDRLSPDDKSAGSPRSKIGRSNEEGRPASSERSNRPSSSATASDSASGDPSEEAMGNVLQRNIPKLNFLRPDPQMEVEKDAVWARSIKASKAPAVKDPQKGVQKEVSNAIREPPKRNSCNDYLLENLGKMFAPDSASALRADQNTSAEKMSTSPPRNLVVSLPKVPKDFRDFPHFLLTEVIPKISPKRSSDGASVPNSCIESKTNRVTQCSDKKNSDHDLPCGKKVGKEPSGKITGNSPICANTSSKIKGNSPICADTSSHAAVDKNRERRSKSPNTVPSVSEHTPLRRDSVPERAVTPRVDDSEKYTPSKPTGSSTSSSLAGSPAIVEPQPPIDTSVEPDSPTETKEKASINHSTDPIRLGGSILSNGQDMEKLINAIIDERMAKLFGESRRRSSKSSRSSKDNKNKSKDCGESSRRKEHSTKSSHGSKSRSSDHNSKRKRSVSDKRTESSEQPSRKRSSDERANKEKDAAHSTSNESGDKKRRKIQAPLVVEEESLEESPLPSNRISSSATQIPVTPSQKNMVASESAAQMCCCSSISPRDSEHGRCSTHTTGSNSTTTDTASPAGWNFEPPSKIQVAECHSTFLVESRVEQTPQHITNWLENHWQLSSSINSPEVRESAVGGFAKVDNAFPACISPAYSTASTTSMKTVPIDFQDLKTLKTEVEVIDISDDEENNDLLNALSNLDHHRIREICEIFIICERTLKIFVSRIEDAAEFTESVRIAEENMARDEVFKTFLPYCKRLEGRKKELSDSFTDNELFAILDKKLQEKQFLPASGSAVSYAQMVGLLRQLNKRKTKKNWPRSEKLVRPQGGLSTVEEVQALLHLPPENSVGYAGIFTSVKEAESKPVPETLAVTPQVLPTITNVASMFYNPPVLKREPTQEWISTAALSTHSSRNFDDPPELSPIADRFGPTEVKSEPKECIQCGDKAEIRCSCLDACYCSRRCQTLHWTTHQHVCQFKSALEMPLTA